MDLVKGDVMNFEPQKLFIGITDLFSILMPGALLTYILKDDIGPLLLDDNYLVLEGTEAWFVFFFSSYLLGHLIFLVGSKYLDDYFYQPVRDATYDNQIYKLAKGKKLSWGINRKMALSLFKHNSDKAVKVAERIREHNLKHISAAKKVNFINTYQWAKSKLTLEAPEAMVTVQRFEADSKFFRSFFVVLFLGIPLFIYQSKLLVCEVLVVSVIGLVFLWFSFLRFADQRFKSTKQAYWYLIALESERKNGYQHQASIPVGGLTHSGGVVIRRKKKQTEYLLVKSSRSADEWVLPKGHIESYESVKEAAVREVREEAQVWARVTGDLAVELISVDDEIIKVKFYLMEMLKDDHILNSGFWGWLRVFRKQPKEQRDTVWLTFDKAYEKATYDETKLLLKLAQKSLKENQKMGF